MSTILITLCLLLGGRVSAALADEALTGGHEPAGYAELVEEAFAEYDAHNFIEARSLFARANELYPNARLLRSLGMLEFELKNYRTSASYLERALHETALALPADLRAETQRLLARARGFLGHLTLNVEPSTTTILVDGEWVEREPDGTLVLEAGDHSIELKAPGYIDVQRTLRVVGGDHQLWAASLVAVPAAAAHGPTPIRDQPAPWGERFGVVSRFTLVLPGRAHNTYDIACRGTDSCSSDIPASEQADRNTMPLLGADLLFFLRPELALGLGIQVQLNETRLRFEDGDEQELGRQIWLPLSAEYRFALGNSLLLPLRALAGPVVVQSGSGLKRLSDAANDACKELANEGLHCTVAGPPAAGLLLALSPGLALELGALTARVELTIGHEWMRLITVESSDSDSTVRQKRAHRSWLTALGLALEF